MSELTGGEIKILLALIETAMHDTITRATIAESRDLVADAMNRHADLFEIERKLSNEYRVHRLQDRPKARP